jgi:hypothetical protein
VQTIRQYNQAGIDFDVVSNPEFLREGSAVADLMKPDRIVVGSTSDRALALMKKVYEPFMVPIMVTDMNSAEVIKHAANSFLVLKTYINAISGSAKRAALMLGRRYVWHGGCRSVRTMDFSWADLTRCLPAQDSGQRMIKMRLLYRFEERFLDTGTPELVYIQPLP